MKREKDLGIEESPSCGHSSKFFNSVWSVKCRANDETFPDVKTFARRKALLTKFFIPVWKANLKYARYCNTDRF